MHHPFALGVYASPATDLAQEEHPVVNVDNLAKRQLLPHFIRLMPKEDWEVRDWAAFFGCTEDRLRIAAKAAGPLTKHVHAFLIRMEWIEQNRLEHLRD